MFLVMVTQEKLQGSSKIGVDEYNKLVPKVMGKSCFFNKCKGKCQISMLDTHLATTAHLYLQIHAS